jgi:4-alpha-glucanotransferase
MRITRSSGVLLHPTSLPGHYGIGDLGNEAFAFVDWLAAAGFHYWQVLPLGPTGFGNSPYQCHSVFAGNPNLISPLLMVHDGLLEPAEIEPPEVSRHAGSLDGSSIVDYGTQIPWKRSLLKRACLRFDERASHSLQTDFHTFVRENSEWLEDFTLFMSLKDRFAGMPASEWPHSARSPERAAAACFVHESSGDRLQWSFSQWLFFRQWRHLRDYAHSRGIGLIGDAPIFAALDSADVWANPELFCLQERGTPTAVAGVPPDYFAPTGQLWGNPLYDWAQHARSGYQWWILRTTSLLRLVDLLRLDHFRGFAGYWEVPSLAPTAEFGRWVPGPAEGFLDALVGALGPRPRSAELPLIAEDLGVVTPDVRRLLTAYDLPGMRVLQFGFTGFQDDFLPHSYPENCVAYTGTHDNDTTRGWFATATDSERRAALAYLDCSEAEIVRAMRTAIWRSKAALAIVPVQDILELGSEARMNFPGKAQGYWEWRLPAGALTESLALEFRSLNEQWSRLVPSGFDVDLRSGA